MKFLDAHRQAAAIQFTSLRSLSREARFKVLAHLADPEHRKGPVSRASSEHENESRIGHQEG